MVGEKEVLQRDGHKRKLVRRGEGQADDQGRKDPKVNFKNTKGRGGDYARKGERRGK